MLYVVLEHLSLGNLKNFLKDNRISGEYATAYETPVSNLSQAQLISLALDVAKAQKRVWNTWQSKM